MSEHTLLQTGWKCYARLKIYRKNTACKFLKITIHKLMLKTGLGLCTWNTIYDGWKASCLTLGDYLWFDWLSYFGSCKPFCTHLLRARSRFVHWKIGLQSKRAYGWFGSGEHWNSSATNFPQFLSFKFSPPPHCPLLDTYLINVGFFSKFSLWTDVAPDRDM